jgi:D-xylose transport system substrate-binding protein
MMKKSSLLAVAALTGAAAVMLAGCAGNSGGTPSEDGGGEAEAGRACVILPDAASSPRWENFDAKYLQEGLEAAGFETDIQNALGDVNKYATIADQQLAQGCGVMLLVDYQGAAEAVATKAKAEGIPVIAYDRPFAGADYYVSFDNVEVGRMEGQTVLDGLEAAGVDPAEATVVYMGGDPTDGNAAMFKEAPSRSWRPRESPRPPSPRACGTRPSRRPTSSRLSPRSAVRSTASGSPTTPTRPA